MILTVTVLVGGAECIICVIIPGSLLCNGCNGTEDAQCFVQILFIKFATVSHSEPEPGLGLGITAEQSRAARAKTDSFLQWPAQTRFCPFVQIPGWGKIPPPSGSLIGWFGEGRPMGVRGSARDT